MLACGPSGLNACMRSIWLGSVQQSSIPHARVYSPLNMQQVCLLHEVVLLNCCACMIRPLAAPGPRAGGFLVQHCLMVRSDACSMYVSVGHYTAHVLSGHAAAGSQAGPVTLTLPMTVELIQD